MYYPRRARLLGLVAVSAILGLGTAGPALASGLQPPLAPVVPIPAVPDPEVPPAPLPDPLAAPGPDPVPNPPVGPLAEPLAAPAADASSDLTPDAELAPTPGADLGEPPPAPEVTVASQSDGENVNVSVRVNSPGAEAPVIQESAIPDVVSPSEQPDITADGGTTTSDPRTPGALAPEPTPETSQSGATNTNVSVRILSPGDNGPVNQSNTPTAPAAEPEAGRTSTSPSSAETSLASPQDSAQYQPSNSQYQSSDNSNDPSLSEDSVDPWNWTWTLTVCDGNATSTSTDIGSNASRDWIWNWVWNWTCESPTSNDDAPPVAASDEDLGAASTPQDRGSGIPQAGPATTNVSVRVLSPGDNGSVTQSNTTQAVPPVHDASSGEMPWIWTWTFTWCGTTTEVSTLAGQGPVGEGSGLDWLWNWAWTWECESSEGTDASLADTGGDTAPAAEAPAAESETESDSSRSGLPAPVPTSAGGPTGASVDGRVTQVATGTESVSWLPWVVASVDHRAVARFPLLTPPDVTPATFASWPAALKTPVELTVNVTTPTVVLSNPPSPALPGLPIPIPAGAVEIEIELEIDTPTAPISLAPVAAPQIPASEPDAHVVSGVRPQARDPWTQAPSPMANAGSAQASGNHLTVQRAQPTANASAAPPSRRPARGPLPFNLPGPLQAGGSSTSTGGSVPSLLTFGFAVLIGFFVLAAPGLGRRIRLARLPSPRSRLQSPIDRPG